MYNRAVITRDCERLFEKVDLSAFKNSTILVTGANGLIGGFLSDLFCYLNDKGNFGINLFLTSYSAPAKAHRIDHLMKRKDVKYFSWDCSHQVDIKNLPAKVDYLFFCSGYGQPSKFLQNNIKTALINVVGLESLLSYMMLHDGGNALFLSTSEIYGNAPPEMLPTPESFGGYYDLENNRAAYKVSKKMGEVICKEYAEAKNLKVKIARVALTYGPGCLLSDKRVLQDFIFKAQAEGQIQMLDSGSSIRNYLYITDSVEVLLTALLKGSHLVYNVGGDTEPISIYQLAAKVGKILAVPIIPGNTTTTTNNAAPRNVGLKMERYRNEFLKYGASLVALDEGIKNTVEWFKFKRKKR